MNKNPWFRIDQKPYFQQKPQKLKNAKIPKTFMKNACNHVKQMKKEG